MSQDSSERIVQSLRDWISTARPGSRVPSTRALSAQHAASPVTVQKAMRTLVALDLVESRPGVGTFVRAARTVVPVDYGWQTSTLGAPGARLPVISSPQRAVSPDAIALHTGYPDSELLPGRLVRAAVARAARSESAVTRAPVFGDPALQAWFAGELARTAPPGVQAPSPRDVLILPGSQSGLSSIFRTVVGPGQPLLVESPTYWGAILAAAQTGVELVPITGGPHGPDPSDVDQALARTGAKAFYAQPTFANPTGTQWSARTAEAVLEVVRAHNAFLIEDDWAHDFAIDTDPHPLAAQDGAGHVIYLRSLTKSVSPSLRVAALIARGPARDRINNDRAAETLYVSSLLQTAALDVVTQPAWRQHLRRVRQQLRDRRNLLADNLREHLPTTHLEHTPPGGLNLWLRLPDGTDPHDLVRACEARGLIISPGDEWFPAEPSGPYIRLNYSSSDPQRFPEAARTMAGALSDL